MGWNNRLFDILAFFLTAFFAFQFEWQANELCWGLWVSSLLTGWVVILSSVLRTLFHLAGIPLLREEDLNEKGDPLSAYFRTKSFSQKTFSNRNPATPWPAILIVIGTLGIGVFTWFHFTFFHTVHAMLMSFFLQMEPLSLFGPNGFINADKGVVLTYLAVNYWPMILGTFIARRGIIFSGNPGVNLKAIYQGVMRIHFFILLSAFLFFLIYFGIEVYQRVLLLILLFLFFFPIRFFRRQSS
ncbi:MAG: hypothetical protein QME90_16080 [Thermodesulfobacteriota bacterium]|nr:hypothetical protein [Thermodesulfobacteriota bacterium]